jgi:HEPN domain-containing protein
MYLGIDTNTGRIYEGQSTYGCHVVWPAPVLTPASFVTSSSDKIEPSNNEIMGAPEYLFREDGFDPITRIRRGRFYKRGDRQPEEWKGMLGPPFQAVTCLSEMKALTFISSALLDQFDGDFAEQKLVILGAKDAFSLWAVVAKEAIHSREVLFTLKSRQSFGILPDIVWEKIPDSSGLVREKLESLVNDIHRAGPESVVDRSREAATAILNAYLESENVLVGNRNDLGDLIEALVKANGKNGRRVIACAAEIPQRLHSRAKHAEQSKRETRPVREQDAELAVQCIGAMLCDMGWAVWR